MPSTRGRDLPTITAWQKPNPFIKLFLFPDGKKEKVVSPVWGTSFYSSSAGWIFL